MSLDTSFTKPGDALHGANGSMLGPIALDLHLQNRITSITADRSNVTDSSGAVQFAPLYGNNASRGDRVTVAQAAPPEQAQSQSHEYIVKRGDNMWNIARDSITHGDRRQRVDGEAVWARIRDIVDATKALHPEIRKNPFYIYKGEHLVIPGMAGTADTNVAPPSDRRGHAGQSGQGSADRHQRGRDAAPGPSNPVTDGGHLAHALKTEAAKQARHIDTTGDCARGPRQTMAKFGIIHRPMSAVSQGELLERSGMFDRVSSADVQPGDYGYRHWSPHTIKRRGLGDLGDSFIVTDCNKKGWQAANDHMFTVPPAGGYYRPGIVFLRPNAKFYAAYKHFQETGEKTHLF